MTLLTFLVHIVLWWTIKPVQDNTLGKKKFAIVVFNQKLKKKLASALDWRCRSDEVSVTAGGESSC